MGSMRSRFTFLFALGAVLGSAPSALAHIDLDSPTDRGCSDQKRAPCGGSCDTRSSNVTALEPGATITVRWTETINHPGHYRISFDDDGTDDFQSPTGDEDLMNPVPPVLLDGIPDKVGGQYEAQVTLPNVECENCTLQLIQVMSETPPYEAGDLYFRCADLALRRGAGGGDAGPVPGTDAGSGGGGNGGGGGCSAAGDSSLGVAMLLLGLGVFLRRRVARG
jgi:MYXO-CTERM domain-containing protein